MKDGVETQTVRDDILAAMEKHDAPEQEVQAEPAEPVEAAEPEQAEQPARDKAGKFAKKEAVATDSGEPPKDDAEAVEEPASEHDEGEQEPVQSSETKRPPQALSASIKGKWGEIPEDVKNEFIRLEQASAKGVASLKQDAHIGRELMEEIKPYEALIQSAGGTPKTAVRNLLQTAAILRTGTPAQKQNAVLGIIKEYGIQINSLEPAYEDPYLTEIANLKNQLAAMQQAPIQQQESQAISAVESFLNEYDDKGNLKYPLDESLEAEFADEIASVRRKNAGLPDRQVLEQAYERMSWKVPEIRQTLLARQTAETEAKRKEKAAQEVAKKQSAAVSVKGTGANTVSESTLTLRQMLEKQILGSPDRI